jgi:hypothetical protein
MTDEDTTDAQWDQQEQNERSRREDEQIRRCRNLYGAFRHECDEFSAEYMNWLNELAASAAYEQEMKDANRCQ